MKAVFALAPLAALALATPALAAPVAMEELVGRALSQSPTLQSARASAEAQESREGVARSTYWPQLNLSSGLAQTTNLSPSQTSTQPISLLNTGVAVRQTLWTFGKLDAAVDQAEAQTEALRRQAQLTAVDVAWGVRQAYLSWAQASGLETQSAEQVRYAEATLAEARARFKAGVAARLDVTRAEATLALNRATLAGAKAATAQARRSLAAAVGQTAAVEGEPAFPATPAVAARPVAELEAAAADHPDLLVGRAQLAQATAATRAAELAGLPDINADGSCGI
ncbi:MAG: TolC family protein, partial [Candidatus Sericytochromatia bacterium]